MINREEAIKKLAEIIFDVSELGYIPYDTEDEQCAMNIARRRIDELFPQLPDNLDEAEFEYAQSLDENPANQEEDKMIYDAFKAGAEWMAGQGETVEGYIVDEISYTGVAVVLDNEGQFKPGEKVIVQIRKK